MNCFKRVILVAASLVALCVAPAALAQTAPVLIQDVLYAPDGTRPTGTIYITNPAFFDSTNHLVAANSIQTNVTNGIVSVSLVPTVNAITPGIFYSVQYAIQNGPPQNSTREFWAVPTSGPTTLAVVRVAPFLGFPGAHGVLTINGDATVAQALVPVNDPNVTLGISTNGMGTQTFLLGWAGQLSVPRGGSGAASETAHGLLLGQGAAAFTALAPVANSIPLWQTGSTDPVATSIPNCVNDGAHALIYSTTTFAFTCEIITGSGGATFQVNGVSTLSQTPINFSNTGAPSFNGVLATFTNPSAGLITLTLSGFLNSAGMTTTGVSAGTYGNGTNVGQFTVDSSGRIVAATNVGIASSGVGTVTSVVIAGTSLDISATGTCTITTSGTCTLDLVNTAATPGSYTNPSITVDAKGRITAVASGSGSTYSLANAASTGTTVNTLTTVTGAPSTAVIASGITKGVVGITISGAGTTGSAVIQVVGLASCVFDNTTVAGDYVQISGSVAGNCHDVGTSYPTAGQIIGIVLVSHSGASTQSIQLFSSDIEGQAGGSAAGNTVCADTTHTNSYSCTGSPIPSSLTNLSIQLYATNGNTGAATLNVNGLNNPSGAPLIFSDGGTFAGGEIQPGIPYIFTWDNVSAYRTPRPGPVAGSTNCLTSNYGVAPATLDINGACIPTKTGANTFTGSNSFAGASALFVPNSGTLPGTCTVGQVYQDTASIAANQWNLCTATNTWTAQGGSGGGSGLVSGAIWIPQGYPTYSLSASGASASETPTSCQQISGSTLGMCVYLMITPANGASIKRVGLIGFTGTGSTSVTIYDATSAKIQQSNTVANVGGANPIIYTFSSSAVVSTPYFYLGLTYSDNVSGASTAQDGNGLTAMLNAMTSAGAASLAYSAANHATSSGCPSSTCITMPSSLGTLTSLVGAGANGSLPIYVAFSNN